MGPRRAAGGEWRVTGRGVQAGASRGVGTPCLPHLGWSQIGSSIPPPRPQPTRGSLSLSLSLVPVPHFLRHLVPFNKRNGITWEPSKCWGSSMLSRLQRAQRGPRNPGTLPLPHSGAEPSGPGSQPASGGQRPCLGARVTEGSEGGPVLTPLWCPAQVPGAREGDGKGCP